MNIHVKLVSRDKRRTKFGIADAGTMPEWGTFHSDAELDDTDQEWEEFDADLPPYSWVELLTNGQYRSLVTSGDIWIQNDTGGTVERVK